MLNHFLRTAAPALRERAVCIIETPREEKDTTDVGWLFAAMNEADSLAYGHAFAEEYAQRALEVDARSLAFFEENDDRRFLREMLRFVVERVH